MLGVDDPSMEGLVEKTFFLAALRVRADSSAAGKAMKRPNGSYSWTPDDEPACSLTILTAAPSETASRNFLNASRLTRTS